MDFKVEYLPTRYASSKPCAHDDVAYVRLAEVEKLIQEAVKFATIAYKGHWSTSDAIEATAFLNSSLVAAWRKGQEERRQS